MHENIYTLENRLISVTLYIRTTVKCPIYSQLLVGVNDLRLNV